MLLTEVDFTAIVFFKFPFFLIFPQSESCLYLINNYTAIQLSHISDFNQHYMRKIQHRQYINGPSHALLFTMRTWHPHKKIFYQRTLIKIKKKSKSETRFRQQSPNNSMTLIIYKKVYRLNKLFIFQRQWKFVILSDVTVNWSDDVGFTEKTLKASI